MRLRAALVHESIGALSDLPAEHCMMSRTVHICFSCNFFQNIRIRLVRMKVIVLDTEDWTAIEPQNARQWLSEKTLDGLVFVS